MSIQLKRGKTSTISSSTKTLDPGQPLIDTESKKLYIGEQGTQIKNLKPINVTPEEFNTSMNSANQKITNLENTTTTLTTKVNTATSNISTLQSDVSTLKTNVSTLKTTDAKLKAKTSSTYPTHQVLTANLTYQSTPTLTFNASTGELQIKMIGDKKVTPGTSYTGTYSINNIPSDNIAKWGEIISSGNLNQIISNSGTLVIDSEDLNAYYGYQSGDAKIPYSVTGLSPFTGSNTNLQYVLLPYTIDESAISSDFTGRVEYSFGPAIDQICYNGYDASNLTYCLSLTHLSDFSSAKIALIEYRLRVDSNNFYSQDGQKLMNLVGVLNNQGCKTIVMIIADSSEDTIAKNFVTAYSIMLGDTYVDDYIPETLYDKISSLGAGEGLVFTTSSLSSLDSRYVNNLTTALQRAYMSNTNSYMIACDDYGEGGLMRNLKELALGQSWITGNINYYPTANGVNRPFTFITNTGNVVANYYGYGYTPYFDNIFFGMNCSLPLCVERNMAATSSLDINSIVDSKRLLDAVTRMSEQLGVTEILPDQIRITLGNEEKVEDQTTTTTVKTIKVIQDSTYNN